MRAPPPVALADLGTVRQRILDLCKRQKGEEWASIRKAMRGERMFTIDGGPLDPTTHLVLGVDHFIATRLIWVLAGPMHDIPAAQVAQAFAPSLAILRADAAHANRPEPDLWTVEHFAAKWAPAAEKAGAMQVTAEARSGQIVELKANKDPDHPAIVQLSDRFYIVDESDPDRRRYYGPEKAIALRRRLADLWALDPGRCNLPLDMQGEKSSRPMSAPELVDTYGISIDRVIYDYTAIDPRVEGQAFVLPPTRAEPLEPYYDQAVEDWLRLLDPTRGVEHWIAFAHPAKCDRAAPALTLLGASHVGKTLLAHGLARAVGQDGATRLERAFAQFAAPLLVGPVLFADEGIPRHRHTQTPMTEELRALLTLTSHSIEAKGSDRIIELRGAVRVVLAANKFSRLFSDRGGYGAHDVTAILRRLFVVQVQDEAQEIACREAAERLGEGDQDPARLDRVSRHFAWIQATQAAHVHQPPAPRAQGIDSELRKSSDSTKEFLEDLEIAMQTGHDWLGASGLLLWVQPAAWARRVGRPAPEVARHCQAYVKHDSEQRRTNPLTGAADQNRTRWIALDLLALRKDGMVTE